jgi:Kef-type K+ transport system membrane component KefB
MSNLDLAIQLFLQLTVILATCRAVGWLGRRYLGQTQVVMEMVAGVLLGPSFLGLLAPALQERLFPRQLAVETAAGAVTVPHPSMAVLFALAQLGLVLYMFLVGLEFDAGHLRGRIARAGLISAAGIVAPFTLGGLAALALRQHDGFFAAGVSSSTAVLYLGASMSITAFPMLARILYERGLTSTCRRARATCRAAVAACAQDADPEAPQRRWRRRG